MPPVGIENVPLQAGSLDVVTFFADGYRCALAARQVRALRPAFEEADDGYPSIDSLLGLPTQAKPGSSRQILTLCLAKGDVEVCVTAPVELCGFEIARIHPLPDMIAARTALRGLRALALGSDGLTLIFDLHDLA